MKSHWLIPFGVLTLGFALLAQQGYPPQQYPQQGYPQQQQGGYPQQGSQQQGSQQQYPQQGPAAQGDSQQGPVDEPGKAVARLGILNGDASVRRGDSSEWMAAAVNAPLMSGDQISVAAGGRAEIELDAAHFLRIGGDTELRLADIENGHYTIQISHGLVTWRVLRDSQAQAELSTPLVGVRPGPLSVVRVEVSADGTSHVTVRKGEAEVATQKGSEKVNENTTMDIRGQLSDPEFQVVAAASRDEWDGWSDQRDNYLLRAQSQRYVTKDVQGVEDLDAYGRWNYDPAYGWVWMPTVAANWAPYQNGQWVWEDYYGWTWVDYAPWGWAPFHYGNWYNRPGLGWAWYPGSRVGRVWWRPAMVGFFGWGGGVGVGFGFGNVGWVPLAPHELYRPWYGRGGFVGVNVVANANIIGSFRNASVAHGVTAVSAADFQRGNFRNTIAVDRGTLSQASLVRGGMPVTPTNQNLRFSSRPAAVTGSAGAARFYGGSAATAASARRTPFVQQQSNVRSAVSAGQVQNMGGQQRYQSAPAVSAPRANPTYSQPYSQPYNQPSRQPYNQTGDQTGNQTGPTNRYATPAQGGGYGSPRTVQVAPSIVRQRPETAPAPGRQYGGYSRQQSAPAPAPAQRSAPAGGGSRSSGSHGNGGRR